MKNIETRLDRIERTIDKGNIFLLLGILSFLATTAKTEEEKNIIKVGSVITFVAVIFNIIGGFVSDFEKD